MKPHAAPVRTPAMVETEEDQRHRLVLQGDRGDGGAERAEDELPLHADVEDAAPERDRDGQAAEDQRGRRDEGLGDRADRGRHRARRGIGQGGADPGRVAEGADQHRVVRGADGPERARDRADRIGAELPEVLEVGDQDEDGADDERGDDGEDRDGRGPEGTADAPHSAPLISMPTFSRVASAALDDADDPAAEHDGHPVADRQDLVELGADDEDGGTGVPLLHHPPVDVLDGPDVEATGRLGGDHQLHGPGELPRHDHLLLVAARERARKGLDRRRADVVVLHGGGRALGDGAGIEAAAPCCRARGDTCRG